MLWCDTFNLVLLLTKKGTFQFWEGFLHLSHRHIVEWCSCVNRWRLKLNSAEGRASNRCYPMLVHAPSQRMKKCHLFSERCKHQVPVQQPFSIRTRSNNYMSNWIWFTAASIDRCDRVMDARVWVHHR